MYEGPDEYECATCGQQLGPCICAHDCDALLCACGNKHLPTPGDVVARSKEVVEAMRAGRKAAQADVLAVRSNDEAICAEAAMNITQRYALLAFAELDPPKLAHAPRETGIGDPVTHVLTMQVKVYFTGDYYAGDEAGHVEGWISGALNDRDDLGDWDCEVIGQFDLPQQ
jgi:hypothetical protein